MSVVEPDGVRIHFEVVGGGAAGSVVGRRGRGPHHVAPRRLRRWISWLHPRAGRFSRPRSLGETGRRRSPPDRGVRRGREGGDRRAWGEARRAFGLFERRTRGGCRRRKRPRVLGSDLIAIGWTSGIGTPEEQDALIQLLRSSGMPGLNSALEREEGILLPRWMREQFLATDPSVLVVGIEGFGDGSQVRASLGQVRRRGVGRVILRRCSSACAGLQSRGSHRARQEVSARKPAADRCLIPDQASV